MADEDKRKAYAQLIQNRNRKKEEYQSLDNEYNELINYANEHRDEYDQLQEGHTADEITQAQITKLNDAIKAQYPLIMKQQQQNDSVIKDLFGVSGGTLLEIKQAIVGLQKGELITRDAANMALGIGKPWQKIKVTHLI